MDFASVLLVSSLAVIIYTFVGYPWLLTRPSRRSRGPVTKDPAFQTSVTVLIAVYNGESMIRRKLETLLNLDYPENLVDIIVVSDGSTDRTDEIVREFADRRVRLLVAPHGGKSAALNHGLAAATGEIIFFTDVRQPLESSCLRHLVANFADPAVGAVTGEMVLLPGDDGEQADMDLYWNYEIWARKRHSEIDSLFNTTGCIYAMRRSLTAPLPPDTLTDDAVMPLRAFFRGYRVIFDPEAIAYDYPALAGTEFRRRFRTLAGLWQVHARFPELFSSSNRMRFHFLSHKLSRLMVPWMLLMFLAATIMLPSSSLRDALLALVGIWIVLALANRLVPAGWRLRRITSPAQTFFVLNIAALSSVAVFFVPPNRLWKQTRVQASPETPAA